MTDGRMFRPPPRRAEEFCKAHATYPLDAWQAFPAPDGQPTGLPGVQVSREGRAAFASIFDPGATTLAPATRMSGSGPGGALR